VNSRAAGSTANLIMDIPAVQAGEVVTLAALVDALPHCTKKQVESALQSLRDDNSLMMLKYGVYRKPVKCLVHRQRLAQPVYDPRRDHLAEKSNDA
jgi:hypothetical protein